MKLLTGGSLLIVGCVGTICFGFSQTFQWKTEVRLTSVDDRHLTQIAAAARSTNRVSQIYVAPDLTSIQRTIGAPRGSVDHGTRMGCTGQCYLTAQQGPISSARVAEILIAPSGAVARTREGGQHKYRVIFGEDILQLDVGRDHFQIVWIQGVNRIPVFFVVSSPLVGIPVASRLMGAMADRFGQEDFDVVIRSDELFLIDDGFPDINWFGGQRDVEIDPVEYRRRSRIHCEARHAAVTCASGSGSVELRGESQLFWSSSDGLK